MGALGRILQIVGWGWLAYSFFAPMLGLPRIDIFPGIIIVFIARVLRVQATRRTTSEEEVSFEDLSTGETRPQPERPKVEKKPVRTVLPAEPKPRPTRSPAPKAKETPTGAERDAMLEKILLNGQELAEGTAEKVVAAADETPVKLSSAEMIAQARQRWNKRP